MQESDKEAVVGRIKRNMVDALLPLGQYHCSTSGRLMYPSGTIQDMT